MSARSEEQPDDDDRYIGRKVAEARGRTTLTQDDVAQRLGLTRSSVANIEAGRQRVHATRLATLAAVLGVDVVSLLPEVKLPPPPPAPHRVTIERIWQVTCETCAPGQPFDVATGHEQAAESRRAHIAEMLKAATP